MSHQSGKGFYQHPIKLLILSEVYHEKIGDRFSKELWWLIVGGLVKSRKLFQLFYHEGKRYSCVIVSRDHHAMRSLLCRALVSGHIGFSNKDYVESKTWLSGAGYATRRSETLKKGTVSDL